MSTAPNKHSTLSRRRFHAAAGAVALAGSRARPAGAAISPVGFALPSGACDCHVHMIGDQALFPMAPDRIYTPPPASPVMLLEMHRALGVSRVALVQPSVYGADNSAMIQGLRQLGPDRARGVAVVGQDTPEATLDALGAAGVRGLRINLETGGEIDPAVAQAKLRAAVAQCRKRGWHIQLYARPTVIAALAGELAVAPAPLVFDHFAGAKAEAGPAQPGFDAVLALVRSGKAYVKLSAPYRVSTRPPLYDDVRPLAEALAAANPARLLWGSDWPHTDATRAPGRAPTETEPDLPIDDGLVLNQLASWIPDPATRRLIFADNPARLYGF